MALTGHMQDTCRRQGHFHRAIASASSTLRYPGQVQLHGARAMALACHVQGPPAGVKRARAAGCLCHPALSPFQRPNAPVRCVAFLFQLHLTPNEPANQQPPQSIYLSIHCICRTSNTGKHIIHLPFGSAQRGILSAPFLSICQLRHCPRLSLLNRQLHNALHLTVGRLLNLTQAFPQQKPAKRA